MVRDGLMNGKMFDIVWKATGMKVDFWPLHDRPFDTLSFAKREQRNVLGQEVPVMRPGT